jgi:uncharacterized protein YeaO (DUF488 family)
MKCDFLDITVKGQDPIGKVFAPTWDMVKTYIAKKKIIDKMADGQEKRTLQFKAELEYQDVYHKLMLYSYDTHTDIWNEILARSSVTLGCFCRPEDFCHRLLLANYLVHLGAIYKGEIL